tara:strand:- start:987 stop:1130 length:144 start_codon:yes stop_codon:yes gene_type:complete
MYGTETASISVFQLSGTAISGQFDGAESGESCGTVKTELGSIVERKQ